MAISFRGPPPPSSSLDPRIRILNLGAGKSATVRLLGDPETCFVHWNGRINERCWSAGCAHCPQAPRKWMAYAPGLQEKVGQADGKVRWVRTVIPITIAAAADLAHLDSEQTLIYFRDGPKASSALRFAVAKIQPPGDPGKPFDVRPYLERVWGRAWPRDETTVSLPDEDQVLSFHGSAQTRRKSS